VTAGKVSQGITMRSVKLEAADEDTVHAGTRMDKHSIRAVSPGSSISAVMAGAVKHGDGPALLKPWGSRLNICKCKWPLQMMLTTEHSRWCNQEQ
jgi:hypothetical protein